MLQNRFFIIIFTVLLLVSSGAYAENAVVISPDEKIDEELLEPGVGEGTQSTEAKEGDEDAIPVEEPYQKEQKSIFDILFGGEAKKEQLDPEDVPENDTQKFEEMPKDGDFRSVAKIRVLDKTLGKVYNYSIKVGNHIQFNELVVRALSCWSPNYPTLLPEAKGLVEIYDATLPTKKRLFYGWMFSGSSSAATFEHPKFDVQVAACENSKPAVVAEEKKLEEVVDTPAAPEVKKKTNKKKKK
ncbi:MAG: DUF2155 domain-containing protein [Rickettsiales bacterium]